MHEENSKKSLKKRLRDFDSLYITSQVANKLNESLRNGTAITFHDMDLFVEKGTRLANVGYEQAKGNLFEYIEAAKLERNNVNAGYASYDKFVATDAPASSGGYGEHTAPDDFRLYRDGEYLGSAQAKVNNNPHDTAVNFENPKYEGMQRVTTSDNYPLVKEQLDLQLAKGEISQAQYDETLAHMRQGLTDESTGIGSGGTSKEELERFRGEDGKVDLDQVLAYAEEFKFQQEVEQVVGGAVKGAGAAAVVSGALGGLQEFVKVWQGEQDFDKALVNTGKAAAKGALYGGATGATSELLYIAGQKYSVEMLTNGPFATAMAAGMVECGTHLLAYAKGEINGEELCSELTGTAVKSTGVYFINQHLCNALAIGGAAVPLAAYAMGASMLMATFSIIQSAELKAEEYRRMAELLREENKQLKLYRAQLQEQFAKFRQDRRETMDNFLRYFDEAAFAKNDYSGAINAIIILSRQCNFSLQHQEFAEFKKAMLSDEMFVLD